MKKNNSDTQITIHKHRMFFLAFLLSILFIIGIPMIIIGAVNSDSLKWLMISGIVFVVLGFYGTPFAWIAYAALKNQNGLYQQIKIDKITDISTLSRINGKNEQLIISEINKLIKERYLTGFVIVDNRLEAISNNEKNEANIYNKVTGVCPYCSASVTLVDGVGKCEYCGSIIKSENSDFKIKRASVPNAAVPKTTIKDQNINSKE